MERKKKDRRQGKREERAHPSRSLKPFLPCNQEAAGKLYLHPADLKVAEPLQACRNLG